MSSYEQFVTDIVCQYSEHLGADFIHEFLFGIKSDGFCVPDKRLLELGIYKHKHVVKNRLSTLGKIEDVDFKESVSKSTGGRPEKLILMTVDCFKHLCMMACNAEGNKVRQYYLVIEKLFKQYSEEQYNQLLREKEEQQAQLEEQQTESSKLRKSLQSAQSKFTGRYKFEVRPCVYILEDPENKYGKYKIGMTKDINERLKSDRTMIPQLKVRCIMNVELNDMRLFEDVIKRRFREELQYASHEWVFVPLEDLIQGYFEIDKASGFNSMVEKNLWRYNMEPPPEDPADELQIPVFSDIPRKKMRQRKDPIGLFSTPQNALDKSCAEIMPCRLLRHDYNTKTRKAPQGMRYCNAFCQDYQPVDVFTKKSQSLMTVCGDCERMIDVARSRLKMGTVTPKQIRENPGILRIDENEKVCRKCNQVLSVDAFEPKKHQCRKCRNKMRSRFAGKFDDMVQDEVAKLWAMPVTELDTELHRYIKTELQKLMTFLGVGRKFNDDKNSMVKKLHTKFVNREGGQEKLTH